MKLSLVLILFLAGCSSFNNDYIKTQRPELREQKNKAGKGKSTTQKNAVANKLDSKTKSAIPAAPPIVLEQQSVIPVSESLAQPQETIEINDFLNDEENKKLQKSLENVNTQTIGAVLPLTGRSANIGQKTLRGLQMGLGLHLPQSNFKLAVIDSEGLPDTARRGVEKLVQEDKAIAIVGSVLSKTASAVSARAEELGVPNISLSQKANITEIGPNIFRNSTTSEMQVRYLVKWSMESLGANKFAIVYPNDGYGVEFANYFWDEVLARGGKVTAVQSYDPKETDFKSTVQRLVGTYYIEARMDQYRLIKKEKAVENNKKKKRSESESSEDDTLPAITDFDAIFIPDSAKNMGQIAATLSYTGAKGIKVLGTNLWNTPDIQKRVGLFSGQTYFVDSIQTQIPNRFFQEYQAIYKEMPSPLELQAYDTGLLLRQLIAAGASSRKELAEDLSRIKNLQGGLGLLNISQQREITRPLFGFRVDKNQTELVSRSY